MNQGVFREFQWSKQKDHSCLVVSPIITQPAAKQQHRVCRVEFQLLLWGVFTAYMVPTHYQVTPNLCQC